MGAQTGEGKLRGPGPSGILSKHYRGVNGGTEREIRFDDMNG